MMRTSCLVQMELEVSVNVNHLPPKTLDSFDHIRSHEQPITLSYCCPGGHVLLLPTPIP
jgi:hypothetical protein